MNQRELVLNVKAHHPAFYDECQKAWRMRGREAPTEILDHIIEKVGFRNGLAGEGHARYHEALWLWI